MGNENRSGAQNAKAARQGADDGSVASQQHKPSEGPIAHKAKAKTATTGTSMEDGEEEEREVRSKGKGAEGRSARTPTRKGGKSRAHRGPPDGCGHVPYPCYHPHYYPPTPYGKRSLIMQPLPLPVSHASKYPLPRVQSSTDALLYANLNRLPAQCSCLGPRSHWCPRPSSE
jgi:hypothetical protein